MMIFLSALMSAGAQVSTDALASPGPVVIRAPAAGQNVQVLPAQNDTPSSEVPDPRLLGMVVWHFDTMNKYGYEHDCFNAACRNLTVDRIERDGEALVRLQFERPVDGGTLQVERLLSPRFGYLPVSVSRARVSPDTGRVTFRQAIDCELQEFADQGVAYPSRVVFTSVADDVVQIQEEITVREVQFDQIDESLFGLAGLSLEPGRVVDINNRLATWDGHELVFANEPTDIAAPTRVDAAATPQNAQVRWLLLLNAVLLSCGAAFIAARWLGLFGRKG